MFPDNIQLHKIYTDATNRFWDKHLTSGRQRTLLEQKEAWRLGHGCPLVVNIHYALAMN